MFNRSKSAKENDSNADYAARNAKEARQRGDRKSASKHDDEAHYYREVAKNLRKR